MEVILLGEQLVYSFDKLHARRARRNAEGGKRIAFDSQTSCEHFDDDTEIHQICSNNIGFKKNKTISTSKTLRFLRFNSSSSSSFFLRFNNFFFFHFVYVLKIILSILQN